MQGIAKRQKTGRYLYEAYVLKALKELRHGLRILKSLA